MSLDSSCEAASGESAGCFVTRHQEIRTSHSATDTRSENGPCSPRVRGGGHAPGVPLPSAVVLTQITVFTSARVPLTGKATRNSTVAKASPARPRS